MIKLKKEVDPQITDAVTQLFIEKSSFGQKLIGVFNPSEDPTVLYAKQLSAALVDLLNDVYDAKQKKDSITDMLFNKALGEILNAQMTIVKLATL